MGFGAAYLPPISPPASAFPSLESPRLVRHGTHGSVASHASYDQQGSGYFGPGSAELNALAAAAEGMGMGVTTAALGGIQEGSQDASQEVAVRYEPESRDMVGRNSPTRKRGDDEE